MILDIALLPCTVATLSHGYPVTGQHARSLSTFPTVHTITLVKRWWWRRCVRRGSPCATDVSHITIRLFAIQRAPNESRSISNKMMYFIMLPLSHRLIGGRGTVLIVQLFPCPFARPVSERPAVLSYCFQYVCSHKTGLQR